MEEVMPAVPALQLRVAVRTDVGMRRATNQDSVVAVPTPNGQPVRGEVFLMVADGMGAHAAGELASKMATDSIPLGYSKASHESAPSALRRAIRDANDAIHAKGGSSPDFSGMGTTCSCLVMTHGAVLVGHVGDSRVYRLRDGVLEQLTFDHSLVWEMAAASNVTADKVPSCIPKNVITRSLGPHAAVNIDLEGPHPIAPGDVYLLCSDGLTGVVDDPLAGGVIGAMPPDAAAEALIHLANLRGGPDNISVVVARVESCVGGTPLPVAPPRESSRRGLGVGVGLACAIACGWFLMRGNEAGIVGAALGLGAAIAYTVAKGASKSVSAPAPRSLGGAFGNGPYSRVEGVAADAAGQLRDLVAELASLGTADSGVLSDGAGPPRGAAPGPSSSVAIDWAPFCDRQAAADGAFTRADHDAAIAGYAAIVSAVMDAAARDDDTHRYQAARG